MDPGLRNGRKYIMCQENGLVTLKKRCLIMFILLGELQKGGVELRITGICGTDNSYPGGLDGWSGPKEWVWLQFQENSGLLGRRNQGAI